MGEVYLACTRGPGGFERLVVVKTALPVSDNSEQMLLAEARLAATLSHTNIVQVHDVGIEGGAVFLAMEYLHGQDLRAIVARSWGTQRTLGLDPAIAIVLSVCAGLHYAHDKRDSDGGALELVHRDVSPSNVIVTYDGGVKLIDFGIAKATSLPSVTELGTVKGKPGYMSPEQCRCEPLDRRSDVFCAGIVLYELTTGVRPFAGDNEYLVTKAILEGDPVWPSALDPAYPPELEATVRRALAKDRRDRQPSAHALHEQLATFASKHRLDVSQFALARAMASLFDVELGAWQAAQESERSLLEYVVQQTRSDAAPPRPALVVAPSAPRLRRARWPRIAALAGIIGAFAAGAWLFHDGRAPSESKSPAPVVAPVVVPAVAPADAAVAAAVPDAAPAAVVQPVVTHHAPPPMRPIIRPAKQPKRDELIR
jgi:serine/threonine protein kinase